MNDATLFKFVRVIYETFRKKKPLFPFNPFALAKNAILRAVSRVSVPYLVQSPFTTHFYKQQGCGSKPPKWFWLTFREEPRFTTAAGTGHFYLEEERRRGSGFHLHLEARVEEILEERRQLLSLLDLRFSVRGDEVERSQRVLVEVGRLACKGAKSVAPKANARPSLPHPDAINKQTFDHFDGHDSQGPDVHLGAVLLAGHYLGRHPVRGSHHRRSFVLLGRDLCAKAKVR